MAKYLGLIKLYTIAPLEFTQSLSTMLDNCVNSSGAIVESFIKPRYLAMFDHL